MFKPATHFRRLFASRSTAERDALARAKRFVERYAGDQSFRAALASGSETASALAKRHGVDLDPEELAPLWRPELAGGDLERIDARRWPLAAAYVQFAAELRVHRALTRQQGATDELAPRFHLWRQRQIARCGGEIPSSAEFITHAIVALELSLGCTKGCWFCGVSADKFSGNFVHDEPGRELWREVVRTLYDLFGEATHTGFCYWATDPSDNPDYANFVREYADITGCAPETTTAAPLKNLEMTRELMRLSRERPSGPVRFSVTGLRALNEIHHTFDARELLDVQLILQNRESLGVMALAGRARGSGETRLHRTREEHATIACVSGFLVNMVNRDLALISPTQASDKWPLGYRVHERRRFREGVEFRDHLLDLIDRHMPEAPMAARPLSFRADLVLAEKPDDPPTLLRLKSAWATHETQGPRFLGALGGLIAQGGETLESLQSRLGSVGVTAADVASVLRHLWDQGLLDDEPEPA